MCTNVIHSAAKNSSDNIFQIVVTAQMLSAGGEGTGKIMPVGHNFRHGENFRGREHDSYNWSQ